MQANLVYAQLVGESKEEKNKGQEGMGLDTWVFLSFFNNYYTITHYCYNYTVARPMFEVAVGSWECPRRAFHCSFASYLEHVRPVLCEREHTLWYEKEDE